MFNAFVDTLMDNFNVITILLDFSEVFGRKSNPCPRNSGKNPARGPPKSAQGRRPRADFGGPRAGFFPAIPRYQGLDFSIII